MAITSKGFAGGPMTDDDFGAIAARGAWVESVAALAVTQPNTGTRTVSVAAGAAVAHGVRAVNDAAISQALTAPGSGGQWYLLALRRDWTAGIKTTTLQVLTGASTGGTTAPTSIPTALPATFQTSSGTAQGDQALAWVWVSSASTTLTIFDLRMIEQRNRVLQAATLFALQAIALIAAPANAAQCPCADGLTYRWNASLGTPAWEIVAEANMRVTTQTGAAGSSSATNIPQNAWTGLGWDTVLSNPRGMDAGNGSQIKLPWAGRYRVWARIAFNNDVPSSQIVGFRVLRLSGVVASEEMFWGTIAGHGFNFLDEISVADPSVTSDATIYFQAWSGVATSVHVANDYGRQRIGVQYLGPA